ncbi:tetratricopeptide repeat protein [candidate division CSSED10-310 bacterium]|uniref:Tetratricopeptide repeat protein n=1 Tax=candidate division CSSED10-310 bacterium TaxID=2855610 RepID=A0ABV6YTC7_UNCC1
MVKKLVIIFMLGLLFFACQKSKESDELTRLKQQALEKVAQRDIAGAIEIYKQAIEKAPKDSILFNNLGELYSAITATDQAEASFLHALDLDDKNPIIYNNLGALYLRAGKLDRAEEMLLKAHQLDSKLEKTLTMLAGIYRENKQYDKAMEFLDKSLVANPEYNETLLMKGFVYFDQGKLDRAEEVWQKLYLKDPLFGPVVMQMSSIYNIKKDYQKEEKVLKNAIDLGVLYPPIYLRYSYMLESFKRNDEAIKILNTALKLKLEDPQIFYRLGFLLLEGESNLAEAERHFRTAFRYNRSSRPIFLDGMAWLAVKRKDLKSAQNFFEQAASQLNTVKPEFQSLHHYYYGLYCQEKKQPEKAKEAFLNVLKVEPQGRFSQKAYHAIKQLDSKT